MDFINNLRELIPETTALVKSIKFLIRETGEHPVFSNDWVRLESMEDELYEDKSKLHRYIGEARFKQVMNEIQDEVESEIKWDLEVNEQIKNLESFMVKIRRVVSETSTSEFEQIMTELEEAKRKLIDKIGEEEFNNLMYGINWRVETALRRTINEP